jgi:hypothetical protein
MDPVIDTGKILGVATFNPCLLHCSPPAPRHKHTELQKRDNALQTENFKVNNIKARFFRFKIASGWDEFCSVHSVVLEGTIDDSADAGAG